MQSPGNDAEPATAPTPTEVTAPNVNETLDTAEVATDPTQPAPATLPADNATATSITLPPTDLALLSTLLQPTTFPSSPLPPLSTTAPRLHSNLLHYQHNPPSSHNRRLHSALTPLVELTSPLYPDTESLLAGMSHAELLLVHLDDMAVLVTTLVEAVGGAGVEASLAVLERVIAKQRAIDEVTDSLVLHQQRQHRIDAVQREIQQLDDQLIHFASTLSAQQLALSALLTRPPTHSSTPLPSRLRPMSVESLVSYAQRLSAVSFSPFDVTERKGVSGARPPAPLETEMAASVLQLTPEEMHTWMEARRSEDAAATGDKLEAEEERKDAMAMPTVAEVESARAGAGAAVSGAGVEKKSGSSVAASGGMRRPTVAAPAAASLLDLDLNPDMDDSDDDEDSDEG